ncbi:MAG: SH3 domain-containing protein [Deltaproteobacteria bacterium]|nr:SH3 domain-containing protein [Deltaproteobacteria bacterium]
MRPLLATLLFGLLVPSVALGQVALALTPAEADRTFRAANDACLNQDSKVCIEGYEKLLQAGYGGADLEYNLGTEYLKQGRLGFAVLHLERALRHDPNDADARANLEKAQRMRVDKLVGAPEETGGGEPLAAQLVSRTSGDRWALAFLLLWAFGGAALAARRLLSAFRHRTALLLAALCALLLALPCGVVTAIHVYVRESAHDAVVVVASVPVREGPRETYKSTFEVHDGLKVRVLDEENGFRRVRLANGLQGWVPTGDVTEISPR